jgi:RHS repeat-associated protein
MSTWDKTNNSFGHSLTALDTTKKKSGSYSGRIDDNYPRQWSKYVYSDTWTPINNSQDTYYTVSGWVYVEDVTTNGSLPNLAKLWIVTRKQGERGYPTGHISTSSTKEGTWEYLSKTVLIPADVKEINVRIENARLGKVWFDDVKIVKGNTSQTVIVEESNYYPFGLKHKGYNNVISSNGNSTAQKMGFGGKELNEELGLEWHDFGARNYDTSLGRWMNLDPLAEQMRRHSPYNYAFDNPIYFIDPDGMAPMSFANDYDREPEPFIREPEPFIIERSKNLPLFYYNKSEFYYLFNSNSYDDTYKVSKRGKVTKVDNKKHYDKDGNEVDKLISEKNGKSKLVDKGILNHVDTDKSASGTSYQYFYLGNSQKSTILFNWLATNTDVEFSLLKYSNHAYISTSFSYDSEAGGADILYETVTEGFYKSFDFTHSHPRGTSLPSGYSIFHNKDNDKKLAQYYQKNFPNIKINWSIKPVGGTNIRYNHKKVLD